MQEFIADAAQVGIGGGGAVEGEREDRDVADLNGFHDPAGDARGTASMFD